MRSDVGIKLSSYKRLEFEREGFSGEIFEGSDGRLHVRVKFQVYAEASASIDDVDTDATLTDKAMEISRQAFHMAAKEAKRLNGIDAP